MVAHHYRHPWSFHERELDIAVGRLARWCKAGEGEGALDEVRAALDDDLDTAAAVNAIDVAATRGKGVSAAAALLGVDTVRG